MKIHLLNHASVIISSKKVSLLCDPWFSGTCFSGGWGLKFHNPDAMEFASRCTHLWISHFHSDHFHVPTLKRLLDVNPEIIVLGNKSFNFQLDEAMSNLGFRNVVSLSERRWTDLDNNFRVQRFPATGIDNMLLLKMHDLTLLNYNDCNLPERARGKLAKRFGKVDILLNNYNHAGKILEYPYPTTEEIRKNLIQNFKDSSNSFAPKYIIPFASHHYYRAPESDEQNDSLMSTKELEVLDERVLPLAIGEELEFERDLQFIRREVVDHVSTNTFDIIVDRKHIGFDSLREASKTYCRRVRRGFLGLTFWVPDLVIQVTDLNAIFDFNLRSGLSQTESRMDHHISCSSEALYNWFSKLYGIDSFWIGAHFEINQDQIFPLRWQLLVGLLTENRLDFRSMIKMIFSIKGWNFLINRREEIISILFGMKFNVGSRS